MSRSISSIRQQAWVQGKNSVHAFCTNRLFNNEFDKNQPVLGLAAFNIDGSTTHQLFKLPIDTSNGEGSYESLKQDACKALRSELKHALLIIVDEISMVSVHN
jgi:hypothetical protein